MSKYTEVSGGGANTNIVATGGINDKGIVGSYERIFFSESAFSFPSIPAAKIQSNWDSAAVAGDLVYLGKCRFEDQSEEAQFFTDAPLDINEETSPATKVIRAILQVNACVHAELLKMSGKSGRIFIQTTNSFLIGRYEDDGDVVGRPATIKVTQRTVPTNDQPVEYTQIDITFTDNDGDELNPMEAKIDWLFSEVEQVFPLTGVISNESSNGSELTFDLEIDRAGSNDGLTGVGVGDLAVTDEDGNALSIVSITPASAPNNNIYTVVVTTALTSAIVGFNGRRTISGVTYYLGNLSVTV